MSKPFVLLDFENVQPKILERLRPGSARVKVFLGQHQTKLMLELVQRLQPFGADAEYIQIQGSGPDAVDFHIAFYIGHLAALDPTATFTIVSKDRGFDPLIRHLAQRGIECRRLPELPAVSPARAEQPPTPLAPRAAERKPAKSAAAARVTTDPPATKPTSSTTARTRANTVVEHLRKSSKPAKLLTLRSSIKALFKPALDDKAIDAVVQSLKDSKKVSVAGSKVSYSLG